jgi:hypothetical protein
MPIRSTLLKKLKRRGDKIVAQCPACAETGGDRKGVHLVVYPDGKFGCAAHPNDRDHRRRIALLAGEPTPQGKPWALKLRGRIIMARSQTAGTPIRSLARECFQKPEPTCQQASVTSVVTHSETNTDATDAQKVLTRMCYQGTENTSNTIPIRLPEASATSVPPPPRSPPERQNVTIVCDCGRTTVKRLGHYDTMRCRCGKGWWALQQERNGPLVAFRHPEQECEENTTTCSQVPAPRSLPKAAQRLSHHARNGMLMLPQLQDAVAAAKGRFDFIRKQCPSLEAYLVFSLPSGQTGLDKAPIEILSEFPGMIVGDVVGSAALKLLGQIKELELRGITGPEMEELRKELVQLAPDLRYDGACQVEIRFLKLKYDLIWKLQADDWVDRNLTPQTRASVQIVLGTLASFCEPGP